MHSKTALEQLVAHKVFNDLSHLRGSIVAAVGTEVTFDVFGPAAADGTVPIVRNPCGNDWSCDLVAKVQPP